MRKSQGFMDEIAHDEGTYILTYSHNKECTQPTSTKEYIHVYKCICMFIDVYAPSLAVRSPCCLDMFLWLSLELFSWLMARIVLLVNALLVLLAIAFFLFVVRATVYINMFGLLYLFVNGPNSVFGFCPFVSALAACWPRRGIG